jgi:hypothetical protein
MVIRAIIYHYYIEPANEERPKQLTKLNKM